MIDPDRRRPSLSRRALLRGGGGLTAALLFSDAASAAALTGRKLIVVIARGAMDGLAATPPIGDPNYSALRGPLAIPPHELLSVDGQFGIHPQLMAFHRLVQSGKGRFAPAVAIPQRIRSHFEAQDLLESGGERTYAQGTGWLNRALQAPQRLKGLSVGPQTPFILTGAVQAQSWSPGQDLPESASRMISTLQDLYADDPLLGPALASGLQTEATADALGITWTARGDSAAFIKTAAGFITHEPGASVAVFSLGGFDTHARQGAAAGQLAVRLKELNQLIGGLQSNLGPVWKNTVLVVVTEFGRTVRPNGSLGTDHGTASSLLLAGGALKSGGIVGDWPTLAEGKLFENRDLAPTLDVRSIFKGLLIDHMGLEAPFVEASVFPDSRAARPTSGLV